MLEEGKILKDSNSSKETSLSDSLNSRLTYTKTNKLVTALYMVTDMMEVSEPLRLKLRYLGAEVISDINGTSNHSRLAVMLNTKIEEIVSFLELAAVVGIISDMNKSILKKEFLLLQGAVRGLDSVTSFYGGHSSISDFLESGKNFTVLGPLRNETNNGERVSPTRIGVQKGHTLMNALKNMDVSNRNYLLSDMRSIQKDKEKFDILKGERRKEIISIIRNSGGVSTITDIKQKAQGVLKDCGEKTLQRELFAMVSDGVLNKVGEKRWSRYSLK